jgi:hypothetical protein
MRSRSLGRGGWRCLGLVWADPSLVALAFDLSRPLRGQVEQAKRYLQIVQRRRVREGAVTLRTVAGLRGQWTRALRLLDAEAADATEDLIAPICGGDPVEALRAEARRLRDGGYLEIPTLPEA